MFTKSTIGYVKVLLSILFLMCLFDWQYGFYQMVRFFGMIGFGILAFDDYEKDKNWFIVWISSLILINPLFKITLARELWNIVDIIWVILLIYSIYKTKNKYDDVVNSSFGPISDGYKFKPLPKWFDGRIYESGNYVIRELTGKKVYLNPFELSMYDFLKGYEFSHEFSNEALENMYSILSNKKVANNDFKREDLSIKYIEGLKWFSESNKEAFEILFN